MFTAQLPYSRLEALLGTTYSSLSQPKKLENNYLFVLVKELTGMAHPTEKSSYDKRWVSFYAPFSRRGRSIAVPFSVVQFKKEYFLSFPDTGVTIVLGDKEIDGDMITLLEEAQRFVPLIKETKGEILQPMVPYDIRRGKIKGKYMMNELLPQESAQSLRSRYAEHQQQGLQVAEISLEDYLNTAAIGYRAAYGKETEGKTPMEMYTQCADGRHGGMLDIKRAKSNAAFAKWYQSREWSGCHPFEIVYSSYSHGIHLWPPRGKVEPWYQLRVTNYAYAERFLAMVDVFIKERVPFRAEHLDSVLDFLTGESDRGVNNHGEYSLSYWHSNEQRKKYFRHIVWDELKVPKWKGKEINAMQERWKWEGRSFENLK